MKNNQLSIVIVLLTAILAVLLFKFAKGLLLTIAVIYLAYKLLKWAGKAVSNHWEKISKGLIWALKALGVLLYLDCLWILVEQNNAIGTFTLLFLTPVVILIYKKRNLALWGRKCS